MPVAVKLPLTKNPGAAGGEYPAGPMLKIT